MLGHGTACGMIMTTYLLYATAIYATGLGCQWHADEGLLGQTEGCALPRGGLVGTRTDGVGGWGIWVWVRVWVWMDMADKVENGASESL